MIQVESISVPCLGGVFRYTSALHLVDRRLLGNDNVNVNSPGIGRLRTVGVNKQVQGTSVGRKNEWLVS